MLGKRKRAEHVVASRPTGVTSDVSPDKNGELRTLLRQHFESRFKPLEDVPFRQLKEAVASAESPDDQSDSDWEGISDGSNEQQVEVVEHTISTGDKRAEVPREELKTFMVYERGSA